VSLLRREGEGVGRSFQQKICHSSLLKVNMDVVVISRRLIEYIVEKMDEIVISGS
jgi:hypothetical protein